jgi:stage V sporulation protein S
LVAIMTLKVAAKSNPSTVAGAIANNVRDGKGVEIVAMGPESINNTVKAIAIARGFLRGDGMDAYFKPEFIHLTIDGEKKSAIKFILSVEKNEK